MSFEIGEMVMVNKWSYSLFPLDQAYLPEENAFPKQHNLFGEYDFTGIILEIHPEHCCIWVTIFQKSYYFKYEDFKKCQD